MSDDWDAHAWGWDPWLGMSVMMAAGFAALLMLLHVLVVRATGAPEPPTPQVRTGEQASGPPVPPPAAPAERRLDERLARSDLDEEEHLARRRDLLRS